MDDEIIEQILDEVWFERQFYESVAGTEEYDVIPVDAFSFESAHPKEVFSRKALELQCERTGLKVLYRISYGDYAVIVNKDGGDKIGIVPETNPDGWPC